MYRNSPPYLRSSIARTVYERLQMENEMQNFDKSTWYVCKMEEDLAPLLLSTFISLNCDEETQAFLNNCTEKADWLFTQVFHALASTFLAIFMTKTSINGLLSRGSMFVFSHRQFEQLVEINSSWRGDHLLDIGAGDGKITEIMSSYFHHVSVTEASPVMKNILAKKSFTLLDIDTWPLSDTQYDVITCLNVLDRCDQPKTMLRQMKSRLKPDSGILVVAIVIPFQVYVEFGRNGTIPSEKLHVVGSTFEEQVSCIYNDVFIPAGLEIVHWSRVPYLCEGNLQRSFFWLTDAIFVLKVKKPTICWTTSSNQHLDGLTKNDSDKLTCSQSEVVVEIPHL